MFYLEKRTVSLNEMPICRGINLVIGEPMAMIMNVEKGTRKKRVHRKLVMMTVCKVLVRPYITILGRSGEEEYT